MSGAVGFTPMVGALERGFRRLEKRQQTSEKSEQQREQRTRGFEEERQNEKKKYDDSVRDLFQSMASNLELIQKDVAKILEALTKKSSLFDMLSPLGKMLQAVKDFLKGGLGKVVDLVKAIPDFLKKIPDFLKAIPDFLKKIPSKFGNIFDDILKYFQKIKFPKLSDLLGGWIDNLKKLFKFDGLSKLLKFDQIGDGIRSFIRMFGEGLDFVRDLMKLGFNELKTKIFGTVSDAIKVFSESNLAKAFSLILDDISAGFSKVGSSFKSLNESISNRLTALTDATKVAGASSDVASKTSTFFDDIFKSLRESKLATLADEFSTKVSTSFTELFAAFRTSKFTLIADEFFVGFKLIATDLMGLIKLPNFAELGMMFDLGKQIQGFDELKYLFGETGFLGKVFTAAGGALAYISKSWGVVSGVFTKITDVFKFLFDIPELMVILEKAKPLFSNVLKKLPFIGWIISAVEGIFASFDTDQIAKDLNKVKEDVSWMDRLSAFFGGLIGSVIGGLIDAVKWIINSVFGTDFKVDGQESMQSRMTAYMTNFFNDIFSIIGSTFTLLKGLITFDKGTIDRAGVDLSNTFSSMIGDLTDVLSRYISDPAKKIYNAAITFIEGIANWMTEGVNGMIAAAIDSIPSRFETRFGTIEFISDEMKAGWKERLSISKTDLSSMKADTTPSVMGKADNQSAAETARLSRSGNKGYTETDLRDLGINVPKRGPEQAQKAGAFIAPQTIEGAKSVQAAFPYASFTGFNDKYHEEKAPASLHTKGLAFDFVIPQNMAMNDDVRKSIATAVANITGGKVIDEYANPSANSTGGHFHVSLDGSTGVDLGKGTFGGKNASSQSALSSSMPTSSSSAPSSAKQIVTVTGKKLPKEAADTSLVDISIFSSYESAIESLTNDLTNITNEIAYLAANEEKLSSEELERLINLERESEKYQRTIVDIENKKLEMQLRNDEEFSRKHIENQNKNHQESLNRLTEYENERRRLQEQFHSQMQGIFRPIVDALSGPAGTFGPEAMINAGTTLTNTLQKNFTQLGTFIFGKQYGAGIGQTFQQLAGVYLNEFINETLAPTLGMKADILNRSINTYMKGIEVVDPQLKQINASLTQSREELQKFEKEGKVTEADIIRAAGKGGFTGDQLSRIQQYNQLKATVEQQEAQKRQLADLKKQYNQSALGDLLYGMTGIALTPRNMIDQYGGADLLTKDLASVFGAPFDPLFGTNKQSYAMKAGDVVRMRELEAKMSADAITSAYDKTITPAIENAVTTGIQRGFDSQRPTTTPGGGTVVYDQNGNLVAAPQYGGGVNDPFSGPAFAQSQAGGGIPGAGGRLVGIGSNLAGAALVSALTGGRSRGNLMGGALSGVAGNLIQSLVTGKGFSLPGSIGKQFGLGDVMSWGQLFSSSASALPNKLGGMFSNMAMSNWMPNFARQGVMDFGTGITAAGQGWDGISAAFQSGNTSHMFGTAAGIAGNVLQGYQYGKMAEGLIGGEYKMNNFVDKLGDAGVAVASAVFGPIGGAIAGGIKGIANRVFGMGEKKIGARGFEGTLSGTGQNNIQQFEEWSQKGGWLRSDKSGVNVSALDAETAKAFSDITKDIGESNKKLLQNLGLSTTYGGGGKGIFGLFNRKKDITEFAEAIKISFTGKETEQERMDIITKAFEGFSDNMIKKVLPFMDQFVKDGEGASDALARLGNAFTIAEPSIRALGFIDPKTFFALPESIEGMSADYLKVYTSDLMDKLVEGFGGAEMFQQTMGTFEQLAFSEEERNQIRLDNLKQDLRVAQMELKDSGVAFSEDMFKMSLEERQDIAQQMVATAREQYNASGQTAEAAETLSDVMIAATKFLQAGVVQDQITASGANTEPVEIVFTQRERGIGAGPAGELSFDPAYSNIDTPEAILADNINSLSNAAEYTSQVVTNAVTSSSSGVIDGLTTSANTVTSALYTVEDFTSNSIDALTAATGTAIASYATAMNLTTEQTTLLVNNAASSLANTVYEVIGGEGGLGDAVSAGTDGVSTAVSEAAISMGLGMMGISESLGILGGVTGAVIGLAGQAVVDAQMDAISAQAEAISSMAEAAAAIGGSVAVAADGTVSVTAAETTAGISVASMDAALAAASADAGGQAAADSAAAAAAGVGISDGGGIAGMEGISDTGGGGGGGDGGGWASGGKFAGNHPMLVGEAGPEIVVPNQGGTVIPTHKIFEALKNASPYDSMARNAIEAVVATKKPEVVIQNVQASSSPVSSAYMQQQEMNRVLQAEKEIVTSVNNSMINQTVNNVSSPQTNIVNQSSGGVRSDNPITGAFTRSVTRPRMF